MAYKLNPIFNKDKSEILRLEIDREFGQNEQDNRQLNCNANVKYTELQDRVPYIAGSFTGWRYYKMINIEELNRSKDLYPRDILKVCKDNKLIRKIITDPAKFNDWEKRHY